MSGFGDLLSRVVYADWMNDYVNAVFSEIDICASDTLCICSIMSMMITGHIFVNVLP